MALSLTELEALRDSILKQMAQPQELHAGDKGLTNRNLTDLTAALATVNGQIAAASGSTGVRSTLTSFSKG